jgi:carboxymethylenebutenolidase
MRAAVLGHVAELDGSFTPEAARALESELRDLGRDATFLVYPGVDHAFFNEDRPEVYDAAAAQLLWDRTVAFLRAQLA